MLISGYPNSDAMGLSGAIASDAIDFHFQYYGDDTSQSTKYTINFYAA